MPRSPLVPALVAATTALSIVVGVTVGIAETAPGCGRCHTEVTGADTPAVRAARMARDVVDPADATLIETRTVNGTTTATFRPVPGRDTASVVATTSLTLRTLGFRIMAAEMAPAAAREAVPTTAAPAVTAIAPDATTVSVFSVAGVGDATVRVVAAPAPSPTATPPTPPAHPERFDDRWPLP